MKIFIMEIAIPEKRIFILNRGWGPRVKGLPLRACTHVATIDIPIFDIAFGIWINVIDGIDYMYVHNVCQDQSMRVCRLDHVVPTQTNGVQMNWNDRSNNLVLDQTNTVQSET